MFLVCLRRSFIIRCCCNLGSPNPRMIYGSLEFFSNLNSLPRYLLHIVVIVLEHSPLNRSDYFLYSPLLQFQKASLSQLVLLHDLLLAFQKASLMLPLTFQEFSIGFRLLSLKIISQLRFSQSDFIGGGTFCKRLVVVVYEVLTKFLSQLCDNRFLRVEFLGELWKVFTDKNMRLFLHLLESCLNICQRCKLSFLLSNFRLKLCDRLFVVDLC